MIQLHFGYNNQTFGYFTLTFVSEFCANKKKKS